MSCNCLDREIQMSTIIQGEDKDVNFRLYNPDGTPFDITQATEIAAIFPATINGYASFVEKKLSTGGVTITSGPGGWAAAQLASAESTLLTVNAAGSFEVRVTIGGKLTTVQFIGVLNVVASLFPTA